MKLEFLFMFVVTGGRVKAVGVAAELHSELLRISRKIRVD